MTPEAFTTLLNDLPYHPRHQNAKGVLAPLVRSMGHLIFLVAVLAHENNNPTEPPTLILSEEEKQLELQHAATHLDPTTLEQDIACLSNAAKANLFTYVTAIDSARDSFLEWPLEDRLSLVRNLANRAAGLATSLDRELIGITADRSDPGSSF